MGKYDKETHEPNKSEKPEKEPQQDRRSHGEDVSDEGTHRRGNMGGNGSKSW